jgi:D-arabinose 1-dehydrogenase-like Zn-dependent alcohol dehydrogenase
MAASAVNGRIVLIGTGRPPPNPPNLYGMYIKNLSLKAISAGSRNMLESLLAAIAYNGIKPVVAKTVPFDSAVEAWREIQRGEQIGKILIRVA